MKLMFFRRDRPKTSTFADRLENLRKAGFAISTGSGGTTRAIRGDYAIDLKEENGSVCNAGPAGMLIAGEIGALIDGGFQKFFRAPSGKKMPALAAQLKELHDFEEDLKEGLGRESYYNDSLGTVSSFYQYDRVKDRDGGVPKRIWE